MIRLRSRRGGIVAIGALLALTATACGGSSNTSGSTSSSSQAGAAGASGSASASASVKMTDVTIGLTSFNSLHIEFLVAKAENLMAPYGINLKLPTVQNVTLGIPGIVSGSLQFAPSTTPGMVQAQQKEPDVVAVAAEDVGLPYQIIAAKNIKTLADLKGKTIGVNAVGSSLDYLAMYGLISAQDPSVLSTVHWVNAGTPAQRVSALTSGKVDAVGSFPPDSLKLVSQGYNVVAKPTAGTPRDMTAILASKKWLQANHDVAVRFLEGYIASCNWLNNPSNKAAAINDIASEMKVSQADATTTYNTFVTELHQFPQGANVAINPTSLKAGLDFFKNAGVKLPANINLSTAYDNTYINAALAADPSLKQ